MFKTIERNDGIFKSGLFGKDALAFNIMLSIVDNYIKYPNPKIFSNNKDCVIVNSDSEHPVIIWTAASFSDYERLFGFVRNKFSQNHPFKIMSKMNMYDLLKNMNKVDSADVKILGVYKCDRLKDVKYAGYPDNITEAETPIVAEMFSLFSQETGENINSTYEENIKEARSFISNPLSQVWRSPSGRIVAVARIRESEEYGRIGCVLTVPEERGKNYAKMLVHFLTKRIFEMKKQPMLFTDFDYEPSNKCYPAVGYDLVGTVANYKINL
ncbi:MAG: GNAT family N-acetyltransferase [Lactobacillaceae bacterium]|jgi:predicted acetyltransferase|nr:GNAT family N-acetyltransferase [Lactobacillaceae bacterium]